MTFDSFLSRLEGVHRTGDQASARCPAHEDTTASLSVRLGKGDRVLVKCHAGCSPEEITRAMGLTVKDLFPEKNTRRTERWETEARYDYHDAQGKVLYTKVRYRKPDGKKAFSWYHGNHQKGRGGDPVLYRLPELAGAETVYLVEGEKDADNLRLYGLTATCSPDGAGPDKWKSEFYNEPLRGKKVIILMDNDDTGRDFGEQEARALYGVAASVKLIDLREGWDDLREHDDISDILARQDPKYVLANLEALVMQTPEAEPKSLSVAEEKPQPPAFFDDTGRRFLFNVMGDYLVQHCHACLIHGVVHIYENGLYRPGENILHGHMLRLVPTLSDARRREVFKYIRVCLDTPVKEVSDPHLVPFKSRIYDLEHDRFLPYSPDHVFLNRFPVDYDPCAPACSIVDQTLDAISVGDPEVKALILETFGNCFYLLNAYRGTVMLYGENGSNGKSTLLNLLLQMVGRENASFLTLQDMAERFRLIDIYGRAINVCDDNGDQFIADSSVFKRVATGGTVTAERKGQDAISFVPFAKCFFALNSLPPVSDKSRAFFSRLLLIPLNADFSQSNTRDISLKDRKWSEAELAYLTRLSVEGLKRLIRQGDFTRPACVAQALARYELENNPVLAFLEDHGSVVNVPTAQVYQDFRDWCLDNGHKTMTQVRFSREVCAKYGLQTLPRYVQGMGTVRCFVTTQ